MDPISQAAGFGLSELMKFGAVGILFALIIIGGIFICRFFMEQFRQCNEKTLTIYKEESSLNREALKGLTDAFRDLRHDIQRRN